MWFWMVKVVALPLSLATGVPVTVSWHRAAPVERRIQEGCHWGLMFTEVQPNDPWIVITTSVLCWHHATELRETATAPHNPDN